MSGLKHLIDIYQQQGKIFIEKLFNKKVTVTENLDGSSFSFEKDLDGNNISFYKRNQDNPITRIDRILMTYYEKPIIYIESLPDDIKKEIPPHWRFGMLYFPNKKTIRIQYDRIPKNHLILTHILVKNEFGETIETINDKKKLDEWADKLGVERPPIIFQGFLTEEQKIKLMEFLSLSLNELKTKFKTEKFSKYLITILNPEIKTTTLGKDLDSEIDSLVFKFGESNEEEVILGKIIDPIFYELSKNKEIKKDIIETPNDIYTICLIDIMNFILERGIENFEVEGIEPEERYISFVFSVFKEFLKKEGKKYLEVNFEKPEFLKHESFKLNKKFITDKEVLKYLEEDEVYEDILQLILNSFRKFKRKAYGLFTDELIKQFNNLVEDIATYINIKKEEKINEYHDIPSFLLFKKMKKDFEIIEERNEYNIIEIIKNKKNKYKNMKENNMILESLNTKKYKNILFQNKPIKKVKLLNEDKQKVNILIGKFQPFNNGHLKMCLRAQKENNLPIFLCVVYPNIKNSIKYPFSIELIKKSIELLISNNQKLFAGYKIIESELLEDIIIAINKLVNPISIFVGENDINNILLQYKWLKNKYNFNEDIKIFKTPQWLKNSEIRNLIKNENFLEFKDKVPQEISTFFYEYVKELKKNE